MSVSKHSSDRLSGSPVPSQTASSHRQAFATALQRSQKFLLNEQKAGGYWVGELMVDSTLVSDMIAYHHWNGRVDAAWQRKAVHHLFSMQLPDGGWNIYHGGPAEVNATIKAYLALKLAGLPVTDPRMLKAREVAPHARWRAADEHLLEALPGLARAVPVGLRAHHPQ